MSDVQAQLATVAARIEASRGVLVIGAGGLSCPALSVLAKSGVTRFTLVDDDRVDLSNLQRQMLYGDEDVGKPKLEVAEQRLQAIDARVRCDKVFDRFAPDNALELAGGHALIVEGADNFASKFLAADASKLSGVPVVQAGAVRFGGWALASSPDSGACVRCVFEDIPTGMPETCSVAGVLGPVVGVLGALQAALALSLLLGNEGATSALFSYEALAGRLRRRKLSRRADCPLCAGHIRDLAPERYLGAYAA